MTAEFVGAANEKQRRPMRRPLSLIDNGGSERRHSSSSSSSSSVDCIATSAE